MKKLYIISIETGECVKEIEVHNEHNYERVLRGLLMRIDTDSYLVDDSEFDEAKPKEKRNENISSDSV